ncbi:MAG: hypothetical protein ACXWDN_07845 [Limisphaerales bacterium]
MTNKFKVPGSRFGIPLIVCGFGFLLVSLQAATTNSVQTTNSPAVVTTTNTNANTGTTFPSFKIIAERNIFSANRSGRVSRGPAQKPTKVDAFTLVGVVDYSKGMFAIFDGSSSEFRKTLKVGDSLAGFKITDLDLDHVTIANTNGADTELHVGSQMRRVDEGAWALGSGRAPEIAKANASTYEAADAVLSEDKPDNTNEAPPSAEANDILKKLMQKRKAEVKNESE